MIAAGTLALWLSLTLVAPISEWPAAATLRFDVYRSALVTDAVFAGVGAVADVWSTQEVMKAGGYEINPLLRSARPAKEALGAAIQVMLGYRLRRSGHNKAANAVRYIGFAVKVALVMHNVNQASKDGAR